VPQDVLVVARLEQGIGWDGHGADLERSPEAAHELRAVVQQEDHALLHLDAEAPQHVAQPIRPGVHVAVGESSALVDDREPAVPALLDVAVDEPAGGIEVARDHRADITPYTPGVKLAGRSGGRAPPSLGTSGSPASGYAICWRTASRAWRRR